MTWRFYALMVMGLGLAANATDADARWNRSENCKAVLEVSALVAQLATIGRPQRRINTVAPMRTSTGRGMSSGTVRRAPSLRPSAS